MLFKYKIGRDKQIARPDNKLNWFILHLNEIQHNHIILSYNNLVSGKKFIILEYTLDIGMKYLNIKTKGIESNLKLSRINKTTVKLNLHQ